MKTKKQNGLLKITPNSELNTSTIVKSAPQLQKALEKADAGGSISLDLTETISFDSNTIKLLLATHAECKKAGLNFHIQTTEAGMNLLNSLSLHRRMSITTEEVAE